MLFQCSSAADPTTGMIKSDNRGMGSIIAANGSEHSMQERTNSDAGQYQIPQDGTKFDKLFLFAGCRSQSNLFTFFLRGIWPHTTYNVAESLTPSTWTLQHGGIQPNIYTQYDIPSQKTE